MNHVAIYLAAVMTIGWGAAHIIFGTRGTVAGFGELSTDNRRILTMEWLAEGIALISVGAFVATAAATGASTAVASGVFAVAIGTLVVMTIVSLFTGFKVAYLPYRLCPFIFGASAVLIAWGAWFR